MELKPVVLSTTTTQGAAELIDTELHRRIDPIKRWNYELSNNMRYLCLIAHECFCDLAEVEETYYWSRIGGRFKPELLEEAALEVVDKFCRALERVDAA